MYWHFAIFDLSYNINNNNDNHDEISMRQARKLEFVLDSLNNYNGEDEDLAESSRVESS